jgi:hypothetical protein
MSGDLKKKSEITLESPDGASKRSSLDTDAISRFARPVRENKERLVYAA